LVWGGASSVGATVIQLAAASGLHIVTTASSANHEFVLSLGAEDIFDYRSPSVIEDIVSKIKPMNLNGIYDAIGDERSFAALKSVAEQLQQPIPAVSVQPCETSSEWFIPRFGILHISPSNRYFEC
jgi:NADPH:quinone reductase-like Zn-dependent oxidoreductase